MGHTTTEKSSSDIQEKKERKELWVIFWLNDEFKKRKYATTAMSLPPDWLARKAVSPQQICAELARRETLVRHTPADFRGSVAVAAAALLLQLRANTHTLKRRRADSSRPLERYDRPRVCAFQQRAVWFCHMPE